MNALLSMERIKLCSIAPPYWGVASTLAAALMWSAIVATAGGGQDATVQLTQSGAGLAVVILMVTITTTVTSEYRYGTINITTLAVPRRGRTLVAKTLLIVPVSAAIGGTCGIGAFYLAKLLAAHPQQPLTLDTADEWRIVLAQAVLYPIAAVIAIAVADLVRHTAPAIALLLVWPLLVETLVQAIPTVGRTISMWMPFTAGGRLTQPPQPEGPTALLGVAVYAATAAVLWLIALAVRRRDT